MSVHIGAPQGEIAESILLPGDPIRARFIADTFLEEAHCYNAVRGMLGYTGKYKGKRVSVQGTGMGVPSISIYAHELIHDYGVKHMIRVGTCGAIQQNVGLRDIVIAMSASTSSAMNQRRFRGIDFAPTADFRFLKQAYDLSCEKKLPVKVGNVMTTDTFYMEDREEIELWADYRILALEMETAALYTLAARHQVNALSILTVSNHVLTGEMTTAEERESTFTEMIELALDLAVAQAQE
ncbi:purine-nucleoside phosphorylase [Paenibacillus thiaminolyticus]|uniref:purine-nucleoside phosphorylase n=1 Tax=Paenibacillus thiaminolyticus TaxID=49283 RepID=UPI00235057B1|nr:purine-nucleoside phosphorylase [Paenibacillus thiaminolyticus]MDG0874203.1 purine-nucleoside phosphorylase [Paenibacillus thiaminolyticus]WCR26841.1 purine-nucleoside phosphorylase [Paenibacillus thiaminolyticus]